MTGKRLSAILALLALFAAQAPLRAYTIQYRDSSGLSPRRWLTQPIIISLSTSLASPPPNIKAGSDVIGAVRRALRHWSSVSNVQFFETSSAAQSISPANAGDHLNLITVAADNAAAFHSEDNLGRTRVFSDANGAITEADIALNPDVLFSSDGTVGTYDLESTFTHEVGHLLGLEHSAIIGATMQPRQAKNGVYGLPAFTQRSLSADDIAGARALYGEQSSYSSISGRLTTNTAGRARSIFGAQMFAEDVATGNVVGSSVSSTSGAYRVDGLAAGVYRVFAQPLEGGVEPNEIAGANGLTQTTPLFRSFVASNTSPSQSVNVNANSSVKLSFFVFPRTPTLTPRFVGMNGELSTAPLPLRAGETFTIYVAGEGVDELAWEGISISSPLINVVPGSLREAKFDTVFPTISFDITVARSIQFGDYSIRLQTTKGELAFLPGAITIEK